MAPHRSNERVGVVVQFLLLVVMGSFEGCLTSTPVTFSNSVHTYKDIVIPAVHSKQAYTDQINGRFGNNMSYLYVV